MPILGINVEKCTNCQSCLRDCPTRNFNMDEGQNLIVFNESNCILCGHCISVCPEDAIRYKDMNDEVLEFEETPDSSNFISYEAINKLFRAKRSIRQYKDEIVPEESINNKKGISPSFRLSNNFNNLTKEEEKKLLEYLQFLRLRKQKK